MALFNLLLAPVKFVFFFVFIAFVLPMVMNTVFYLIPRKVRKRRVGNEERARMEYA